MRQFSFRSSLTVFLLLFVWFVLYAIPYVPFLIAVPLAALIRPIAKFLQTVSPSAVGRLGQPMSFWEWLPAG